MKQFGGKLTEELIAEYATSPNWKDDKFVNLVETDTDINYTALPNELYERIFNSNGREPKDKIKIKPLDKEEFVQPADTAKIIWYGHSAVLINMNGTIILIDPMLGPDASPTAPFKTLRFSEDTLPLADELPDIDLVLLSHDHYDHLDMDSIIKLKDKTKHFYVALGIKRHLAEWGIDENTVTEFDWWDNHEYGDVTFTFTPSRHFSGRSLTDKQTTLWGGWVISTKEERIYFSGDGSYGQHFKEIGEKLGPFNFGLVECGQYDELWPEAHMTPEESVQAAIEAKIQVAMPVHWGAFSLSGHPWKDPIERFTMHAKDKSLTVCHSAPGDTFCCADSEWPQWWEEYD